MGTINNIPGTYAQWVSSDPPPVVSSSSTNNPSQTGLNGVNASPSVDQQQLSPLAQVLSTLQQLQQSDPVNYTQVTQQIATNLQSAVPVAQSSGNTTVANHLTQLATDFTNASKSGQLPSIQDLAQAIGGGHHHGHHVHGGSRGTDPDGDSAGSSTSASGSSAANQGLNLLSLFQASPAQNPRIDPNQIIITTMSNVGITEYSGS